MTSFRNNWHVSPDGNVNHTGSRFDPVPLAWILRGDNVRPGNTITILPGEYVGDYVAKVIGTAESPIVVTFGDARIKGSFQIASTCQYVTINNADIFDAPDTRWTEQTGSSPPFLRPEGLAIYGANSNVIHATLQDVRANGVGFWASATNSVLYGLWANAWGWNAPDRGHGHAPYVQNGAVGTKLIENCVFGIGYGGAMRVYTTNANALYNVTVNKNICVLDQLFLGGHSPAANCAITNNRVWGDMLEVGETDRDNQDILIDGNYVVGYPTSGSSCIILRHWETPTITNNTFVLRDNTATWQIFPHVAQVDVVINNNIYYLPDLDAIFAIIYTDNGSGGYNAAYKTVAQWQAMGYDTNSTFIEGLPTDNRVFVEHSTYNDDICHVAIFNWQELSDVEVDFSGGNLTVNGTYHAYNALNPGEYHEFIYDGELVSIPMTGWTVAIPSGDVVPLVNGTWPLFGAFVVKGS